MKHDQNHDDEHQPQDAQKRHRFKRTKKLQRKIAERFDLRKALFILPNAFTCSSIFCGLYAILLATHDPSTTELLPGLRGADQAFYQSALAIFFAGFFDLFDGRVARMTKTQSEFGVQMDSLADAISFGVAPAVLVYKWALQPLGVWGLFVSFSIAACGTIRLARFNVLAAREEGSSDHFLGLPIPLSAAMIVSLVIAQQKLLGTEVEGAISVCALVAVLCYLMVSNVRYRTFKNVNFRKTSTALLATLILAAGGVIAVFIHPAAALVVLIGSYIASGLIEEVLFFSKRRAERLGEQNV